MAFNDQERQIIEWGKTNGKSQDEIAQAVFRHRNNLPGPSQMQEVEGPGIGERVGEVIAERGERVHEAITGEGEFAEMGTTARGFRAAGEAALAVPSVAIAAAPEPVRKGLGKVGEFFQKGFTALTDKIASTELFSEIGRLEAEGHISRETTPELYRTRDALNIMQGAGEVADVALMGQATATGLQKGVDVTRAGVQKVKGIVERGAHSAVQQASGLREKARAVLGGKAVDPKLKTSVQRSFDIDPADPRFLHGTADRMDDVLATYDDYFKKSAAAIDDITADPAVSIVGEKIGNAFDDVVEQRRAVGKVMGDELKKIGGTKANVLSVQDDFVRNLDDAGLIYDKVNRTVRTTTRQTAMSADDVRLLEKYAQELQKLGSKPTVGELDSFMKRIDGEIVSYKGSKGIIQTTNGERIIKGSLAQMRDQFDPVITNNPALKAYSDARSAYADYSNFIEEGVGHLGKYTQAGDYAKDASIAKSSVQSILNSGKKDWLIKLEELTGYRALDDSVLALQAMKDAGDFRGVSLLETMADGAIPASRSGLMNKVMEYVLEKGGEAVIGDPSEQTRAYLKSLSD